MSPGQTYSITLAESERFTVISLSAVIGHSRREVNLMSCSLIPSNRRS
jgi:hypothetical protein